MELKTVEMHTGGEPLRIIKSGYAEIEGETILEKRNYAKNNLDHYRRFLMFEPRGHFDMYGAIPVKPDLPEADVAYLFMHNEGYSTMCGHAVIALGRYCVDNKVVEYQEPETLVNIQCPCGLVRAHVRCCNGKSGSVRFQSIPAFAVKLDAEVTVPSYGRLKMDVSYGGAFYLFLPLKSVGLDVISPISDIKKAATEIKAAFCSQDTVSHPDNEDLGFIYGVIFTDDNSGNAHFNLTIFAQAAVDRSPCGSGTTARMALLHARGLAAVGERKTFHNPLTKSAFQSRTVDETTCGKHKAVIVEVEGNAYYTGVATFTEEEKDGLKKGFLIT